MTRSYIEKVLNSAWTPTPTQIVQTNLAQTMAELNFTQYRDLHRWSVEHFRDFWHYTINKLNIYLQKSYDDICDLKEGVEKAQWLAGAKLNIVESCFQADKNKIAVISQNENGEITQISYDELNRLSNQIANGLVKIGIKPGDAIAIIMPLHIHAVAIYLAIIKAGAIVVSIAESFSAEEIKKRCELTQVKLIFTQDTMQRNGKYLPLYKKLKEIIDIRKINLQDDKIWQNFLQENDHFTPIACLPDHPTNYLFSSGTTGKPKVIIWTQTTPIKCASDAFYHCDVQKHDIVSMPTSLGWMMGPWLIYASLINQGTMAIFDGIPTNQNFGEFVQQNKVTIMGVVPSLVSQWHASHCMEHLDWSALKLFFSTGECSNEEDMLYLMSLANNKPIIEYCGGTEIGGAYITSTPIEPNIPATFTTPALGLDFIMLDEKQQPCDNGEVAIIPPSIGLSNQLLNRDHHQVYFSDMPIYQGKILRRHGDHIQKINDHCYRNLGRVDDTMNLGGIKISAVEIERTLLSLSFIQECAAIGITPAKGGPSLLVIYVQLKPHISISKNDILNQMQLQIKKYLNPLFKIHDVIIIDALPRTASNKIMRRTLRDNWLMLPH